ncbi:response regulator transcription factor [Sphingomonas montanisoli]|uniref:Response regulator transcription factor n=1 Tax=Sphingomonas montanisoli TaxID=2606412 RepID=A0A5D9CBQ3_9SPHN|nr:response regulator transcription factor [Sphingomonas montanisoli]TZG29159.1 response regulator transcription factor [Sphingomonas montanisoli]
MRIAILDDEPQDRAFVARTLTEAGHVCYEFPNARTLSTRLRQDTFDLLILDWNMPDKSGVEILEWMRNNLELPVPALLLTNRSADEDIVTGLGAGADDYIVKPVQPPVLLARINALMRRSGPREAASGSETFGPYTLHPMRQNVTVDGDTIALTAKEFELTATLFRNLHRPLSRAYLLEMVWGRNPDLPTRTLDAHISRIRSKLGLRPERGYRLVPVYSYGYRLEAVGPDGEGGEH